MSNSAVYMVKLHRERSVVETRQETLDDKAFSAGVKWLRVSHAKSDCLSGFCLFVSWIFSLSVY